MSANTSIHRLVLEERPDLPDDDISIIKLAKDMMLKLGVRNDGHVLLKGLGFRQTVGIVQEAKLDRQKVSVSASSRRSLRVRAGDRVMACAFHGLPVGEYVRLAPVESASLGVSEDLLASYLRPHFCRGNRPVSRGDVFVVRAGPAPVEFEVMAVSPGQSIVVSAQTRVECDNLPVQPDNESKYAPASPRVPFSPMISVTVWDLKGEELLDKVEILRSTRAAVVKQMIWDTAARRLAQGLEATRTRTFLKTGCGIKLLHCRRSLEDDETFESEEAYTAVVEMSAVLFVQTFSAWPWGNQDAGGDAGLAKEKLMDQITRLFRTSRAFAAMNFAGGIVTWGDAQFGGDSSKVEGKLSSDVLKVYSTGSAFAALKKKGIVVTWGDPESGGDSGAVRSQLQDVAEIYCNDNAFAAVKVDCSVFTWGLAECGGDSSIVSEHLSDGVRVIVSSEAAFTAVKFNGDAFAWGHPQSGGDAGTLSTHLTKITEVRSNRSAFAALSQDGCVYTWGDPACCCHGLIGEATRAVQNDVVATDVAATYVAATDVAAIYPNRVAFAAVKTSGEIVTWGNPAFGGDSASVYNGLSEGVVKVYCNDFAFAAVKAEGAVVSWGDPLRGGDSNNVAQDLTSGVSWIDSNPWAFAAVKVNGSVVTWGEPASGGDSTCVRDQLAHSITSLCHTERAFAVLKADGSVVTWGEGMFGGDSQGVADQLASGVSKICSSQGAFAVIKEGGAVVAWGDRSSGGDYLANIPEKLCGEMTENLSNGVAELYSNGLAFVALREAGIYQS